MKERIISAIVMLIIFIPILIIGKLPFAITCLILALMAIYELLNFKKNLPILVKSITYILTGILVLINILNLNSFLGLFLMLVILCYLISLVFINNQDKYNYKDAFYLIGITLFIGFSFQNLIYLRNTNLNILIYLLLTTVATDTFALLVGKCFGKHKLAPEISPNKTIEGSIGGSCFGVVIASLFYIYFIKDYSSLVSVILTTLFLTIIGQLGDLVKSSIKRYEKVKDFSNLIPGHGGILDRFDSIIFVMMAYILISNLF